MDSLTSNFLPKFPQLMNSSSLRIEKSPQPKITSNSLFKGLKPIKKFITQNETLEVVKNPPPSIETAKKRRNQSLFSIIFKSFDEFICNHIDSPLHPSIDPKLVLPANFAPVDELHPTACKVVEGSLPPCLDGGAYIRNGPNPQFIPRGPYHLFDGDGMLQMIKFTEGKVTFCSRYVKTYKYKVEHEAGYSFFPSVFSSFNGCLASSMARCVLSVARVLTWQFNPITHGFGVANTSLALFCGQLFALCESDLPYSIKVTSDGDIITLGRHDFHSKTPFFRMTAHPKVDRATGETFAYRYNIMRPFLTFFRIDPDGRKQPDVPISSIEDLTVIHDFAITKNYAIFPDVQIVVNPLEVLRGKSLVIVDPDKVPRLGIIPRYALDECEMLWIDVPGFNMMHLCNAWEEDGGDTIVMVASNITSVEQILENIDLTNMALEKITIDVKAKTVQRQSLSEEVLEFGVINPLYAAKKNRYVYASIIVIPKKVVGVVKLDLSQSTNDCNTFVIASHIYGSGRCGGEPFFVPREPNNPTAEEDDGYLVTYVYDENTNKSVFLVMDAKSPNLDVIAVVQLPRRVPHGFHGLFISKNDLASTK